MQSGKVPLTVLIIAKNEEKRIEDCLKSVHEWAEEILVLDDMSTDATAEIARRYGAKVIQRAMDYEGRHRNFGASSATQPWILSLDADERATPELARDIAEVIPANPGGHVCYSIPLRNYLGDLWLKGAGYYPAAKSKLYKKGEYTYDETARVHPRVFYKGTAGPLKGEIIHLSFENLEHWLRKFNRETSLEAEKWVRDARKVRLFTILRKSVDRFLKNYLFKKGWTMGFYGFLMSLFHGLYQLVAYAKFLEISKKESPKAVSA